MTRFLNLLGLVTWFNMGSVLGNDLCAREECTPCDCCGDHFVDCHAGVNKCPLQVRHFFTVLPSRWATHCRKWGPEIPTVYTVFYFSSNPLITFLHLGALALGTYIFTTAVSSSWTDPGERSLCWILGATEFVASLAKAYSYQKDPPVFSKHCLVFPGQYRD